MATHKVTFLPINVTVEVDDAKFAEQMKKPVIGISGAAMARPGSQASRTGRKPLASVPSELVARQPTLMLRYVVEIASRR